MYAGFQDYKQNFKIDESCILWKALDIIVLKIVHSIFEYFWIQFIYLSCSILCGDIFCGETFRYWTVIIKIPHGHLLQYRLLDSLVVECWHRVREVMGSIPSQGPRHTKDVIKMVPVVPLFSTQHWKGKYWVFLKN